MTGQPNGFPDGTLLSALLENVPDAIWFKDRDSRFIALSRSTAIKHGLSVADMIGKTDFDLFSAPFAQRAYDDERRIMRTGLPIVAQLEKEIWPDGRVTWTVNHKMPLKAPEGEVVGTFGIGKDVTQEKTMEQDLEKARDELLLAHHHAGMAEVATHVLHNVGNVLNSVNVSASVLESALRRSRAESLERLADLLRGNEADLVGFLARDPKGRLVPQLLQALAAEARDDQTRALDELTQLKKSVEHIKEIVATQQVYASTAGLVERLDAVTVLEDALRMNEGALARHHIRVERRFAPVPLVQAQRGKLLQILVNLILNAKQACEDPNLPVRAVILGVEPVIDGGVRFVIQDTGVGIPRENLVRIFTHGFTTRPGGHGFGLHSAANAAKEMGGSLTVTSEGQGRGATFTLELPK